MRAKVCVAMVLRVSITFSNAMGNHPGNRELVEGQAGDEERKTKGVLTSSSILASPMVLNIFRLEFVRDH